MLNVHADILAALKERSFTYAWLVELPDGLNFTTYGKDIVADGKTYEATGHILAIPGIGRSKGIKIQDLSLTLAASDGRLKTAFSARKMTGEPIYMKLALMNADDSLISGAPVGIYKGFFDTWRLSDSGKQEVITVTVSSPWSQPKKTAGRLTNPTDQQTRFPGDRFFEFAHEEQQNIGWGGEK